MRFSSQVKPIGYLMASAASVLGQKDVDDGRVRPVTEVAARLWAKLASG